MKKYSIKSILLIILVATFISCDDNDDVVTTDASVSMETTNANAEKTYTTIKIDGKVLNEGGITILTRGVCWSTNPNPTIEDSLILESSNEFSSTVNNLLVNTAYYFRTFATNEEGVLYSEQQLINTLSLEGTSWKFTTLYANDFMIYSKIDLFADHTTKFDEMDLPGQCPGCFITYGRWSLNGNTLTYIWQGSDPALSTYVYTGTVNGMTISGTYTHLTAPDGTWDAIEL